MARDEDFHIAPPGNSVVEDGSTTSAQCTEYATNLVRSETERRRCGRPALRNLATDRSEGKDLSATNLTVVKRLAVAALHGHDALSPDKGPALEAASTASPSIFF